MSQLGTKNPTYNDGRTKQSFADETDINKILKRAQKSGTISHLNQYEPRYGDFSHFDFGEAQLKLAQGREIFDALPVELRSEFSNRPGDFFDYVNNPENKDRLGELLPALAEPGRQNVSVKTDNADEAAAQAKKDAPLPEPKGEEKTAPAAPAEPAPAEKPALPDPSSPVT